MPKLRALVLILATVIVVAVDHVPVDAQASAASQAPAIAVNIALEKDKVPVGQSPWADLTVKNLTDDEITMSEPSLHAEGENGELPLKPQAQIVTERLQPRTAMLRTVVYVPWTIGPRETSVHKFKLTHFFDFSESGQYAIYMEVMDPSSHKSLRTNRVKFEIQLPAH